MIMRGRGIEARYAKFGYIFSIPFVIAFILGQLYPLLYTVFIGFTNLKGLIPGDISILENPLQNFQLILNNRTFRTSFSNTLVIWTLNFIPQILLALLLTAWFTSRNYRIKGQGAFKVLFYMPNIITAASIAILFGAMFAHPIGPVNYLLQALGINDAPVNFLLNGWTAKFVVAFIQFWMWYGYTMLILISGVLGMNPDMFEAADIDGASGAQTFFLITLPNLRTILLYTLVTSMIGGLNMFDIPRLFIQGGQGGPNNATLTASLFIYLKAFAGTYLYNEAAAASMLMFIVIAVLAGFIFFVMRDREAIRENKLRKLEAKKAREAAN
jgi:multiple sugar transport system permease protein